MNSFSISIILSAVSHKFCLDQNASRLYSFRYWLSPFEFEQNLCPQGSRLKLLRKPTHNREDRLPFNRNTANMALKRKNQNQFMTHCQDECKSLSGGVPKNLTLHWMKKIFCSFYHHKRQIRSFPTMYNTWGCFLVRFG